MINILKYKKIFISFSVSLSVLSLAAIIFFGFNVSIDFKGGTVYQFKYTGAVPEHEALKEEIQKTGLENFVLQKVGEDSFVIKVSNFEDETKKLVDGSLDINGQYMFEAEKLKSIGPSVSSELTSKSLYAILFVSIIIILFITYVFSGVSRPVSSFKYGLVAIVALIHDILIPTGIFAILGAFFLNYQIDVLFVTALLAILGFSVNDTIVVFDRIRENLKNHKDIKKVKGAEFEDLVNTSLNQTLTRSINTSLTTFFVLATLFFVGGQVTQPFALVLLLGVLAGTYSSIFLASPLLVLIEKYQKDLPEPEEVEAEIIK